MNEQILIPESYLALFQGSGMRLSAPPEVIFAGYDLCEDLAQLLSEKCRGVHVVDGVDEGTVLLRAYEGLVAPGSLLGQPQSVWVVRRAAELLEWLPFLPQPCALEGAEHHAAG